MFRILILMLSLGGVTGAFAFPCFLTLVKDSCWAQNYDVTVDVADGVSGKNLVSVFVPRGTSFGRQKFVCTPGQTLTFSAFFAPIFWQSDTGKHYPAIHTWTLPAKAKPTETAWNISLCYEQDFSGVPFPPDAEGNCICDMSKIPPIPPQ